MTINTRVHKHPLPEERRQRMPGVSALHALRPKHRRFVEEYLTETTEPDDANLEADIYVFIK